MLIIGRFLRNQAHRILRLLTSFSYSIELTDGENRIYICGHCLIRKRTIGNGYHKDLIEKLFIRKIKEYIINHITLLRKLFFFGFEFIDQYCYSRKMYHLEVALLNEYEILVILKTLMRKE